MFYILDNLGYIEEVSTHYIERDNKTCTEYKGAIPEGYETLADWVLNANIRAYKITNGNLVYDANRDAALQAEYNVKLLPNEFLLYENSNGTNGNITLSETSANFRYLEVFYQISGWGTKSVKVESGKGIQLEIMSFDTNDWNNIGYIQNIKVLNVSGQTISNHIHRRIFFYPNYTKPLEDGTNNIYITKVIGYR